MTTIRPSNSSIVLINTFFVGPDHADELPQLLVEATDTVMRNQPGLISANLHICLDRERIVNYARWRSKHFQRTALIKAKSLCKLKINPPGNAATVLNKERRQRLKPA